MKRIEISVLLAVVFSIVLSVCAINTECDEIRSNVLRLHVLANSDSEKDQQLKLRVRDRLLEVSKGLFSQTATKEDAVRTAKENMNILQREAQSVVDSCGDDYQVSVSLETCYFTTRSYDEITLPAGNYEALRVVIGKGEGHNWWCVMFPPLCVSAASDNEALLSDVLTDEQMELVESDGYEVKFKCVELYEELMNYFSEKSK